MAISLTPEQVVETRARIRKIAEQHMAKRGNAGISLRAIAAEMGWTAASLYRYYPSKSDLVLATRTSAYTRFSERIEAAYDCEGDLWDRSRAIGDAYVDFAREEPAAYKLIFAYEQDDSSADADLAAARARSLRTLIAYVEDMIAAGLIEGDAEVIAHVYWAALHGLVALQMARKLEVAPSFDTIRHASNRLITRGARPPQRRGSE